MYVLRVQMVAHGGGSKNLAAVQLSLGALQSLGFQPDQVVKMVAHKGGSKNLAAVQVHNTVDRALDLRGTFCKHWGHFWDVGRYLDALE